MAVTTTTVKRVLLSTAQRRADMTGGGDRSLFVLFVDGDALAEQEQGRAAGLGGVGGAASS